MPYGIIKIDPTLKPFEMDIENRVNEYKKKRAEILKECGSLLDFANGFLYFGFNKTDSGFVYREWAPAAEKMYLRGDFNNWQMFSHPMKNIGGGVFEITLPTFSQGQRVEAVIIKNGTPLTRVPSYATKVVQDKKTHQFFAEVEDTFAPFPWTDGGFKIKKPLFIYECHIGMSTEEYKVGSYKEFRENILPRIKSLGYNALQIMAVAEHPYYASFGYQVSSFFAPSTRYGSSTDLKELINAAHNIGLAVLLDVVHSHSTSNVGEGLNNFDGTDYQYFHSGERGNHPAWGTKLFDYGKLQVLHFLLSNLKYWMTVFHFDGFRFDGVTSMLYRDHGLGKAFTNYNMYFSENTDIDALTYLTLANELVHSINKNAVTIAEDMSGMPGMCLSIKQGGIDFDYRLSMGLPDMWIDLVKNYRDEDWSMGRIWYELTNKRKKEKRIAYAESHDQALVGDKTLMFRLCDSEMYYNMNKTSKSMVIDRGMALHKIIRLVTATLGGEGYLNFMGNEFGHPEWIDFPRRGNGYSYNYCRRQWSLAKSNELRYAQLMEFDKALLSLLNKENIISKESHLIYINEKDKIIVAKRGELIVLVNLNPTDSFKELFVEAPKGIYKVILSTDHKNFGGFDRVCQKTQYVSKNQGGKSGFKIYLPCRTGVIISGY